MKLVRDILNLGSVVASAGTSTTSALVEAGSSYASEWREDRALEVATNKLERAKKWDLLNEAVKASNININARKEAEDFLSKF